MVDRTQNGFSPSSEEPSTRTRVAGIESDSPQGENSLNPLSSHGQFAAAECPTLSSPSSEPRATPLMEVEAKVRALESHVEAMERELTSLYGAVEHLARTQESLERVLQQQRHGRFIMWGTL